MEESISTSKARAKNAISTIAVFCIAIWAYDNFAPGDDRPIELGVPGQNVLWGDGVAKAIDASQNNEPKFDADFKNRAVVAEGGFKEANKDLFEYNIAVSTEFGPVVCHTANDSVVKSVASLNAGQPVRIFGLINKTWMGQLELKHCSLEPQVTTSQN